MFSSTLEDMLLNHDKIFDVRTIRLFKDKMAKKNVTEQLFEQFVNELNNKGLIINKGRIVDAGRVEVACQRNTREENALIKGGKEKYCIVKSCLQAILL